MNTITFRLATAADAKLLWLWRNAPLTRQSSLSSEEISWKNHSAWFAKNIHNPKRKIYIANISDEDIGTARSDLLEDGSFELSWTVAPNARGKGFGGMMLVDFANIIIGKKIAKIKSDNIPSQKMAIKAGFKKQSNADQCEIWLKE